MSMFLPPPRPLERDKLGLALAGGGFRAALFHLGVLRRMAELDLLRYVEVLSTVSGGSIIGALYILLLKKRLDKKRTLSREDYLGIVEKLQQTLGSGIRKNLRTRLGGSSRNRPMPSYWPETAFRLCCPGMELRQLRYFMAVADEGNISRAAKRIFLTQPALSRQIKALEDEIDQCLLERQAHSIRLTPVGELLVREARELLEHADQVLDRVRAAGHGVRLRVGYAPSLAAGMLSATVENFTQTHPSARVELYDLSTAETLAGLEGDTLDVAVTVGPQRETRGLKWTPLCRRLSCSASGM